MKSTSGDPSEYEMSVDLRISVQTFVGGSADPGTREMILVPGRVKVLGDLALLLEGGEG